MLVASALRRFCIVMCLPLVALGAQAQTPAEPVSQALKLGHTVIVMRHASSPRTQPDPGIAT